MAAIDLEPARIDPALELARIDPALEPAREQAMLEYLSSLSDAPRVWTANSLARCWADRDPYDMERTDAVVIKAVLSAAEIDALLTSEAAPAVPRDGAEARCDEEEEEAAVEAAPHSPPPSVLCDALRGVRHHMIFSPRHTCLYLHRNGHLARTQPALWAKLLATMSAHAPPPRSAPSSPPPAPRASDGGGTGGSGAMKKFAQPPPRASPRAPTSSLTAVGATAAGAEATPVREALDSRTEGAAPEAADERGPTSSRRATPPPHAPPAATSLGTAADEHKEEAARGDGATELEPPPSGLTRLNVRCCELHTYAEGGGLLAAGHRDNGSVLTMSVLLSDPRPAAARAAASASASASAADHHHHHHDNGERGGGGGRGGGGAATPEGGGGGGDEELGKGAASHGGGEFVMWREGEPVVYSDAALGRGDAILFRSERLHNVAPVTCGTRRSLVIELWEPPANAEGRFK